MPREFSFFDRGIRRPRAGRARASSSGFRWPSRRRRSRMAPAPATASTTSAASGPSATLAQVQAQIDALLRTTSRRFPQFRFADLGMYTAVTPLQDALTRGVRRTLYLLWGGAAFVLLIGAINIANLALARTSDARARAGHAASRSGPPGRESTRQLVVEAMVPLRSAGLRPSWWRPRFSRRSRPSGSTICRAVAVIRDRWRGDRASSRLVSAALGLAIGIAPAIAVRRRRSRPDGSRQQPHQHRGPRRASVPARARGRASGVVDRPADRRVAAPHQLPQSPSRRRRLQSLTAW